MADYQFNPNQEQWKEIPGFPGYEVSDHGRVRSYWKRVGRRGYIIDIHPQRIRKPGTNGAGYLFVPLAKDGKQINRQIHTLLLITFVGPCPPGMEGAHGDGDKSRNHFDNLRWDTPINNAKDKIKHGTMNFGVRNGYSILNNTKVLEMRRLSALGYKGNTLAKMFNTSTGNVSCIINRKTWPHI
jgi:hypothetical protein